MKMFILGILVWSLICTIVCGMGFGLDDFEIAYFCAGPVLWTTNIILGGCRAILKKIKAIRFKGLVQDPNGNVYWCESSGEFDLIWGYVDGWKPIDREKLGLGNTRYCPSKAWKKYPRVPNEILQKAKENEELREDEW